MKKTHVMNPNLTDQAASSDKLQVTEVARG